MVGNADALVGMPRRDGFGALFCAKPRAAAPIKYENAPGHAGVITTDLRPRVSAVASLGAYSGRLHRPGADPMHAILEENPMPLTATQIEELHSRLLKERARLKGEGESVLASVRDTEREVGDEMDAAETSRIQGDATLPTEQERELLAEIERALGRIEAGTYDVSELTGEPIEYARLAAVPWARLTASEQEDLEHEMAARRRMGV